MSWRISRARRSNSSRPSPARPDAMSAQAGGGGPIRVKIASGKPLFNAWLSLGSALAVELAAEAGADLVTIDRQHGAGGDGEMIAALTAAGAARIPSLVRVVANDYGLIGRA